MDELRGLQALPYSLAAQCGGRPAAKLLVIARSRKRQFMKRSLRGRMAAGVIVIHEFRIRSAWPTILLPVKQSPSKSSSGAWMTANERLPVRRVTMRSTRSLTPSLRRCNRFVTSQTRVPEFLSLKSRRRGHCVWKPDNPFPRIDRFVPLQASASEGLDIYSGFRAATRMSWRKDRCWICFTSSHKIL